MHVNDISSQSRSIFTLSKGVITNSISKQKRNARSSIEAELNAVDDKI